MTTSCKGLWKPEGVWTLVTTLRLSLCSIAATLMRPIEPELSSASALERWATPLCDIQHTQCSQLTRCNHLISCHTRMGQPPPLAISESSKTMRAWRTHELLGNRRRFVRAFQSCVVQCTFCEHNIDDFKPQAVLRHANNSRAPVSFDWLDRCNKATCSASMMPRERLTDGMPACPDVMIK